MTSRGFDQELKSKLHPDGDCLRRRMPVIIPHPSVSSGSAKELSIYARIKPIGGMQKRGALQQPTERNPSRTFSTGWHNDDGGERTLEITFPSRGLRWRPLDGFLWISTGTRVPTATFDVQAWVFVPVKS